MDSPKNKPLRLVLIASPRTVYLYATYLDHLLLGLADASIPVALVCPPAFDPESLQIGSLEAIKYPTIELPFFKRLNRKLLFDRLDRFDPDLLHCLCQTRAEVTRKLARRLNVPYVLSVNALQSRLAPLKISSRRCARIIVPAASIASNITRYQTHIEHRIERINLGSFPVSGCASFEDPSRLPTIVTAHPMDHSADFEKLFDVYKHMQLEGREFAAIVMGQGKAEHQIRKMISAMGLQPTVTLIPPMKPWRSILASADIFVQPVPRKSFNPFMLEAMSVGTAVAACKGGVDDLIIEDQTAVIFDHKDKLSIMRALQRLLCKHEYARMLASRAQQYVRENHSVGRMISSILHVYQQTREWYKQ